MSNMDVSMVAEKTADKPKRTRNRIALSCSICRARKVKCSKDKPHCKQCEKAGVAHLCTYLNQPWAAQSQEQISKDHELKILKDRVKSLEEMLAKVHNSSTTPLTGGFSSTTTTTNNQSRSNSNEMRVDFMKSENNNQYNGGEIGVENGPTSNPSTCSSDMKMDSPVAFNTTISKPNLETSPIFQESSIKLATSPTGTHIQNTPGTLTENISNDISEKYNNDELDLTKRFDMLHLKNTGTVHLGATHWLAIMKGDPYLKLLWSHIFTIREKISEWHKQQALYYNHKMKKLNKSQLLLKINNSQKGQTYNIPDMNGDFSMGNKAKCPVTNATGPLQCPVTNMSAVGISEEQRELSEPAVSSGNSREPSPHNDDKLNAERPKGKCPFDHTKLLSNKELGHEDINSREPVSNVSSINKTPTIKNITNADTVEYNVQSTDNRGKCPVMHDVSMNSNGEINHAALPNHQNLNSNNKQDDASCFKEKSIQEVIDELNILLPPQRVIALLVDKFFKFLYPVIPILDEQSFKCQIYQIIQAPTTNGKQNINIKINKSLDYCTLGILVFILRLTWLSLPFNGCNVDLGLKTKNQEGKTKAKNKTSKTSKPTTIPNSFGKDDELLKNHEISATAVNLVRKYLVKFDEISSFSNKNVNITTVQFAIFYKMYLSTCPEGSESATSTVSSFTSTGHDNETHQVLLSSIVQMAFSCGLHRDPDNFPQLNSSDLITLPNTQNLSAKGNKRANQSNTRKRKQQEMNSNKANSHLNKELLANTEKLKHTWRKTWFFIVSLDVQQSLALGTPRLLRNLGDFSDTKLPCSSKIDYVNDIKELIIVKNFTLFFQIDLCIIAVLNHILNVSLAKSVRKFELDELIGALSVLSFGQNMQEENNANIQEVVDNLLNKGLLPTSEASALASTFSTIIPTYNNSTMAKTFAADSFDHKVEETAYTLPVMKKIFSTSNNSFNIKKEKESATSKKLDLPQEITTRALFFSKHLTIRMLLYLLNYILFTFYEPKGTEDPGTLPLTGSYAQNALKFAMDGFKNSVLFLTDNRAEFDTNKAPTSIFNYMEVLLSPQCLDACHRSLQFMICLILRARCGPLTGVTDPAFTSSSSSASGGSSSEDEVEDKKKSNSACKKDYDNMLFDSNEELELNEDLGDLLLSRMELFYRLTRQVSVKYKYAEKMTRSTGFFLTLLKNPSGKNKTSKQDPASGAAGGCPFKADMDKSALRVSTLNNSPMGGVSGIQEFSLPRLKHTGVANMSRFFKNIPSLIISAGGDQLKRCPVYQDAVGSIPNEFSQSAFSFPSGIPPSTTQGSFVLPKVNPPSAYQPVTYSTITRRTSDIRGDDLLDFNKRRKLSSTNLLGPSPEPPAITPRQRMLSDTLPLPTSVSSAQLPTPALKLNGDTQPSISIKTESPSIQFQPVVQQNNIKFGASPADPMSNILAANEYLQNQQSTNSFTSSPSLMSETTSSSSVNYAPDFEEFLKQSTDVNGLIVNPSSIMEAVGFEDFKDPNSILGTPSGSLLNINNMGNNGTTGNLRSTSINGLNNVGGMPTMLDFMGDGLGSRQELENSSVWVINEDFQGMENTGIESLNEIINGTGAGKNNGMTSHRSSVPSDFSSWE